MLMKPFHVVSISLIPDQAAMVISVEKCQRAHSSSQWKKPLAGGFHREAQGSYWNRTISRWDGLSPPRRGRGLTVPLYLNSRLSSTTPPPPELSPLPVPLRMVITILITATMTATQDLHFHALSSRRLTFKATVEIVFSLLLLELKNKLLNQPLCILTLEFGSFLRKVTFRSK